MFSRIYRTCVGAAVGMLIAGCGSTDAVVTGGDASTGLSTIPMPSPVILSEAAGPCTEAHTVCMTVKMPATIPGPPTHLAVGYYKAVPVMTPADARGTIESPPLVAGQTFRLKATDGTLSGGYFPVVLVYMPGGGDIIAVDNLDYTAEAAQTYTLGGAALNIPETLNLIYGI